MRTPLLPVLTGLFALSLHASPLRAESSSPPAWGPCPPASNGLPDNGIQCATIDVPLDYRQPEGRQIQVAISRIAASSTALRRGILLFNPGGPGGSGLDLPRLFALLLPAEVRDRYDLIGFDPRFIGQSTALSCGLDPLSALKAFPPMMQPGGFDDTVSFMQKVADTCQANAGDLLPFATTANTARDMDRIRQALGEEKLSYLGYSYGTYLGAVYSTLFPQRTDRIILDSSVGPLVWRLQFRGFGPGGDTRFPDFARFAAASDATYHLGATPREVRALFFRLVDRLDRDPLPLGDGLFLDGPLFRAATFGALYGDVQLPGLAEFWQATLGELDPAGLRGSLRALGVLDEPPTDNFTAAGLSVVCGDAAWPRSPERYRKDLKLDTRLFPMFGEVGSNIWPCAFWPVDPVEPPVTIGAQGPSNILIVQNLRDPATPYPGALAMRAALGDRARLVSIDQGGHGAYLLTPSVCGNVIPTAFLISGSLPDGDPFCAAETAAPPAPIRRMTDDPQARAARELQRRVR